MELKKKYLFHICCYLLVFQFHSCITVKRGQYAVATITPSPLAFNTATNSMGASFYVNGKKYKTSAIETTGIKPGDSFLVLYDSLHPKRNELLLSRPVFKFGTHKEKTVGVITYKYDRIVHFCYNENDNEAKKIYCKTQYHLYSMTIDTIHFIREGARFEVEYDVNNPERAIIYYDRPVPIGHAKITMGVFSRIVRLNGPTLVEKQSLYRFESGGKMYSAKGPVYNFQEEGEKFKVVYDSLNPDIAQAFAEEPVFAPEDVTETVTGVVSKMKDWYCAFTYKTKEGKGHTKEQAFYIRDIYRHGIRKGARFEVKYLVSNPKISIIYFDKPVKK